MEMVNVKLTQQEAKRLNLFHGKAVQEKAKNLKWWQVALVSAGVSILGGLTSGLSHKKEQKLYTKNLKQAPWAPPAWLFGPAWMVNNFVLLMGIQRLLNAKDMPEKKKLLRLQALIWGIFFSFNYIYFRKKSTALAAVWTMTDAVAAAASFLIAYRVDKKIAFSYLPLLLWTLFASTLADYQALKNPDQFLKTKALMN